MKKIYEYDEDDIKEIIADKLGLPIENVYFLIENNNKSRNKIKVCAEDQARPSAKMEKYKEKSCPNSACLYH